MYYSFSIYILCYNVLSCNAFDTEINQSLLSEQFLTGTHKQFYKRLSAYCTVADLAYILLLKGFAFAFGNISNYRCIMSYQHNLKIIDWDVKPQYKTWECSYH